MVIDPNKKVDEYNTETQETSPDVSADKKENQNEKNKEQEKDITTTNTQINLEDLKQKIELIKTSNQYSKEIKNQAAQIESDLNSAPNDPTTLTQKAKQIEELEKKKQPESFSQKAWNRFQKTSLGVGLVSLLKKRGVADIFGIKDETKTETKPDNTKATTQNNSPVETKNSEAQDEESPQVDAASIDEVVAPNPENTEGEKKEEVMSKNDVKLGVENSMKHFKEVANQIDSNFSMFTKGDKEITADGKKLDEAYQQVLDQLKHISQLYPKDAELQKIMRSTMYELAMFYRDKGDLDNDHHVDPIKALNLLLPAVSEIVDINGHKADFPPMPTETDLLDEIRMMRPQLATKITNKLLEKNLTNDQMDQVLEDKEIKEERDEIYKKLFDKREKKFDAKLTFMYGRYKAGKCPDLTQEQKSSLEALKDLQGVADWRNFKDRNASMTKNIAAGVGAIVAGVAATVFTAGAGSAAGVAGVSAGSALLSAAVGGAVTTVGLWAVDNKWMGGTELGVNFGLNAIPFGAGKLFSMLREGAFLSMNAARVLRLSTYVAEGVVDVGVNTAGQMRRGDSFGDSLEKNIGWALFPLVLHAGSPVMKGMKDTVLKNLFARKQLADETLHEVHRAKILAALGNKQLSQEILDNLNKKLSTLKRNETLKLLDDEAALLAKKDGLLAEVEAYIAENTISHKGALPMKQIPRGGLIGDFNQVGDRLVVVSRKNVRTEMVLIEVNGKDSYVRIGNQTVKADLSNGKLNIKDPLFKGETITGSCVVKHPNARGVDVNKMMGDLKAVKSDVVNVQSLMTTFEAFGPQMSDLAKIYPQMQRDLRNLRKGGKSIEDFMGYKVTKTDAGFELEDIQTKTKTTVKNSGEVLAHVLPQAEASGQRILTYKLQHLFDNMTAEKLQKILQRGKEVRGVNGKPGAYQVSIDGVSYEVHFDATKAQKVTFKDLNGAVIADTDPIIRQLESKVFVDITKKYKAFVRSCKDIQTPLGKLIPDAIANQKFLKTVADKLRVPIVVVEKMTIGPFLEACEKFADLPTLRNFISVTTGGGGVNTMLLVGILMMDTQNNERNAIGPDYAKYLLGGRGEPIIAEITKHGKNKIEQYKAKQTKGETFTST